MTDDRPRYDGEDEWPWQARLCRDRQYEENVALRAELAKGEPRPARYAPDFTPIDGPSVFLQWKNTDVCLDFHCACGAHGHYDGYFAYSLRCPSCDAVVDLPHSFAVIPAIAGHEPVTVEVDP